MNENGNIREERALDALIAAALLPDLKSQNMSAAELAAFVAAKRTTLPEDLAALKAAGNPFAEPRTIPQVEEGEASTVQETALAMNRKNKTDAQSEQTRAELKKKARELLG